MLGLCRRLNYHISAGLYTQQKSTYFADFRYFTRRNFPDTWDDQIGGVFNLLKGEWFNASDKYIQAHFMYESPFILFKVLRINSTKKFMQTASRYILSERFYLSQLWTPVLPSYTEVGYGSGTISLISGYSPDSIAGITKAWDSSLPSSYFNKSIVGGLPISLYSSLSPRRNLVRRMLG